MSRYSNLANGALGAVVGIVMAAGVVFIVGTAFAVFAPAVRTAQRGDGAAAPSVGDGYDDAAVAILGGAASVRVSTADCASYTVLRGIPPYDVTCPCHEPRDGGVCYLVRWTE